MAMLVDALSTLGGGLLGGAARLVPEVLKFLDRRSDRAHELAMFPLQLQADAAKTQQQLAVINAQHLADADSKDLEALIAGVTAQGARSGVAWVDALNSLIRPLLTVWWCIFLYSAMLAARFVLLVQGHVPAAQAIVQLWGPQDDALVASIMAFWFLDRSLRKGGGAGPAH